jgi:DMSO/TMAO reductase YedYZ molybdopterin-dependent catalytic subunit
MEPPQTNKKFLTEQDQFVDVSRGNPKPFTLKGEALTRARLTEDAWRLEIVSDGSSKLEKQHKLEDGTALDYATLMNLGKKHGVKFLKAMQCNNIPVPLGEGLWEGVPLREVLKLVGKVKDVRRIYYWGFHNNDAAQMFQSSLSYNQAMETPPWDLSPFIGYRLNGQPISLKRGGPVRMIVPWAHGFKSIKWLERIVLTNDYKANDTYALQNNDPESYLKTAAYLDDSAQVFKKGEAVVLTGSGMAGWSGLKRIEYWLRPDTGTHGQIADDDPAWKTAVWQACELAPPPQNWAGQLPGGVSPADIWGFDPATGQPKNWPLRYSVANWSATLKGLTAGAYEFRVRAVDLNDFAQPEPRPYQKSGLNLVKCKQIVVMG